jgi:hypothetical protein
MTTESQGDDSFGKEVLRLRAEFEHRRVTTNLYPPGGRLSLDMELYRGDKSYMTYWFDDGTEYGQCVRIFDGPGTLSGDILRLHRNLPPMSGHFEIDGDDIHPLDRCLEHPPLLEDDSEDISDLVSKLPLVDVDPAKYFMKKGNYRSEIENLIKCQGDSVPGHPPSPHLIQLLGRSADGKLVFEKLSSSARTLGHFPPWPLTRAGFYSSLTPWIAFTRLASSIGTCAPITSSSQTMGSA